MKTKFKALILLMLELLVLSACGRHGNGEKPAAPTGVNATAPGASLVIVEWDMVSGATSYNYLLEDFTWSHYLRLKNRRCIFPIRAR